MAKIKITDIPKDTKIDPEEMKKVVGGLILKQPTSTSLSGPYSRAAILFPGAADDAACLLNCF